jgi:hypothetical protein
LHERGNDRPARTRRPFLSLVAALNESASSTCGRQRATRDTILNKECKSTAVDAPPVRGGGEVFNAIGRSSVLFLMSRRTQLKLQALRRRRAGVWLLWAALISAAVGIVFRVTTNGMAAMFSMWAGVAIAAVLVGFGVWCRRPD